MWFYSTDPMKKFYTERGTAKELILVPEVKRKNLGGHN